MSEAARPYTLLLVDEHRLVRGAIARLISQSPRLKVIGELDNADELIPAVDRLHPDAVLLDIEMPGRNAFDVASLLTSRQPPVAVIFLTGHEHPDYAATARKVGAAGFLGKSTPPDAIVASIERILEGDDVFDVEPRDGEQLSPRALEVLTAIGRGDSNRAIAESLCLSPRTVERHVERLMDRLGVRDRLKLALIATRMGLTDTTRPPPA